MNYSYEIDKSADLIHVKYTGVMVVGDTIACTNTIIADPDFRIGMNSISDLTEGIFDWTLTDIDRYRAYVKTIMEAAGECKWALISRGGITERNAKLFVILHEIDAASIKVKLFDNYEEARRWVTVPRTNSPHQESSKRH